MLGRWRRQETMGFMETTFAPTYYYSFSYVTIFRVEIRSNSELLMWIPTFLFGYLVIYCHNCAKIRGTPIPSLQNRRYFFAFFRRAKAQRSGRGARDNRGLPRCTCLALHVLFAPLSFAWKTRKKYNKITPVLRATNSLIQMLILWNEKTQTCSLGTFPEY